MFSYLVVSHTELWGSNPALQHVSMVHVVYDFEKALPQERGVSPHILLQKQKIHPLKNFFNIKTKAYFKHRQ